MKKLTLFGAALMLLTFFFSPTTFAQQKNSERTLRTSGKHSLKGNPDQFTKVEGHDAFKGVVRVKFKNDPQVVAKLDRLMSDHKDGRITSARTSTLQLTQFPGISAANANYGGVEMKRVFRPAGKFEAKHRAFGLHLWYEVTVDKNTDLKQVLAAYGNVADVQLVEPRFAMDLTVLSGTPNDPQYSTQAGHYDLINSVQAWGVETGLSSVVVAIEDQGVDYNHPDLAGHMWTNPGEIPNNGVDDDNNGYVDDYYGWNFGNNNSNIAIDYHGTHVGGTVSAETNNGVGVAGVAGGSGSDDGVRLMSLSVFGNNNQGGFDEAFIYAADNGAAISQNSWGGGAQSSALENAIDYFIANGGGGLMNGGLVVFAAGNDNSSSTSIGYPGSYAPVVAVASTTHSGVKSSFSNYGSWVDIAAPGSNILSTYPVSQGSYNSISGTSMACPHVSGVAALVLSNKVRNGETISAADLRNILESTSNNALLYDNNASYAGQLGAGMLDAYAALTGQVAPPPPPPACTASYATDVTLSLTTDNYGSETSWTLKDNLANSIIASGSGYGNNQTITETFQLAADGNYTFSINDSYGDGICCSYGNGSYSLTDGNGVSIASGGSFGSGESTNFCIDGDGTPPPACDVVPTGLASSNIAETSFTLSWNAVAGAVSYDVEVNGSAVFNSTGTTLNLTGGTAGTTYACKVRANCASGSSAYSAAIDVTTSSSNGGGGGNAVIFEDFFESGWGNWNDGGSDCARYSGSYSYEGSYSIRIRDNSGNASSMTTDAFDATAYDAVEVEFYFYPRSMENGEDFWLQASNNGGSSWSTVQTWARGTDFNNNTFYTATVTVNGLGSNAKLRFRCDASGNNDQIYVDQVTVRGVSSGTNSILAKNSIQQLHTLRDVTTSIEEEGSEFDGVMTLYPNPTEGKLNIILDEMDGTSVEIYNINGQLVKKSTLSASKTSVNVADLKAGVYVVKAINAEGVYTQRFMKK